MKSLTGQVLSAKTAKTVTVGVPSSVSAPLYGKVLRRVLKFHAHDELGAKEGDLVKITECRPLSRTKFWRVVKIVATAKLVTAPDLAPEEALTTEKAVVSTEKPVKAASKKIAKISSEAKKK